MISRQVHSTTFSGRRRYGPVLCAQVLILVLVAVTFVASPIRNASAAGTGDDYPSNLKAPAKIDAIEDPWLFYNRECTSFVAWRLNQQAGTTSAPWAFTNNMNGPNGTAVHFGHGYQWNEAASQGGWPVNSMPSVGAVAQWDQYESSPGFTAGDHGHVAIVMSVNADGSVTTEDYNADGRGVYATHPIVRAPRYLHIVDGGLTVLSVRATVIDPKNGSPVNPAPASATRPIRIEVLDGSNQTIYTRDTTASRSGTGYVASVDLGSNWTSGYYTVKVKIRYTLRKIVGGGVQPIVKGTTNTLQNQAVVPGDVDDNNVVNITDYNLMMQCYSDTLPPKGPCSTTSKQASDLTDDGSVNGLDYNQFLRVISSQPGG